MTAQSKRTAAETKTGAEAPDSKDPIERTVDNVNGQSHCPQLMLVMSPPRSPPTSTASPLSTFHLTLLTPFVTGAFLKRRLSL